MYVIVTTDNKHTVYVEIFANITRYKVYFCGRYYFTYTPLPFPLFRALIRPGRFDSRIDIPLPGKVFHINCTIEVINFRSLQM